MISGSTPIQSTSRGTLAPHHPTNLKERSTFVPQSPSPSARIGAAGSARQVRPEFRMVRRVRRARGVAVLCGLPTQLALVLPGARGMRCMEALALLSDRPPPTTLPREQWRPGHSSAWVHGIRSRTEQRMAHRASPGTVVHRGLGGASGGGRGGRWAERWCRFAIRTSPLSAPRLCRPQRGGREVLTGRVRLGLRDPPHAACCSHRERRSSGVPVGTPGRIWLCCVGACLRALCVCVCVCVCGVCRVGLTRIFALSAFVVPVCHVQRVCAVPSVLLNARFLV